MCKLCNDTDVFIEYPYNITTQVSTLTREFNEVAKNYTGEYPCNKVAKIYKTYARTRDKLTMDEWIIKRLLYKYRPSTVSNANFAQKKLQLIGNVKPFKGKYIKIEPNIQKVVYLTGTIRYQVNYYIKKHGDATKKFKTLKEAQQFKQEVLNNDN